MPGFKYLTATNGPIGLWNFNNSMNDLSGNGYNLSLAAGTELYSDTITGLRGFAFDGNTGLEIDPSPAGLRLTGDMTVEVIASLGSGGGTSSCFVSLGTDTSGTSSTLNYLFRLLWSATAAGFEYFAERNSGTDIDYAIDGGINVQTPSIIWMRRTGNQIDFGNRGLQVGATSVGLLAPTGGSATKFGVGFDFNASFMRGSIASVAIFDRALTNDELYFDADYSGFITDGEVVADFDLVLLVPINSNTFRAYFSYEPQHRSPLSVTDSLNRNNWEISVSSGDASPPVIEGIENATANPLADYPDAWSVDIRLDRRIELASEYEVAVSNVVSYTDAALVVFEATSNGISNPRARLVKLPFQIRSGLDYAYDTFAGTYSLDSRNDFALQGGLENLRKRVIRRLISVPGGFYHLPRYGLGVRLKGIYNPTSRAVFQRAVRDQVLLESDVADCSVQIVQPASGVIQIVVQVVTVYGSSGTFAIPVSQTGEIMIP